MNKFCNGSPCEEIVKANLTVLFMDRDINILGRNAMELQDRIDHDDPDVASTAKYFQDKYIEAISENTVFRDISQHEYLDKCIGCTGLSSGICKLELIEPEDSDDNK